MIANAVRQNRVSRSPMPFMLFVVALAFAVTLSLPSTAVAETGGAAAVTGAKPSSPLASAAPSLKSIATATVSLPDKTYLFEGKAVEPVPTVRLGAVKLKLGRDYKLTYRANGKAGTATLTVTGQGSYSGSASKSFRIAYPLSKAKAAKLRTVTYCGKAFKPVLKLKYGGKALKKGRDYKVAYKSNKQAGTAKVVIVGKGIFAGKKTVSFKIKKAPISPASVSGISKKKYTGSSISPRPKVRLNGKKLKLGRDYRLEYRDNTDVGTAKVIVRGIGNYKGKKTVSFKIYEPAAKSRSGGGGSSASDSSSSEWDGTVYWTPSGSVYHLRTSCPTLSRSRTVYSGSVEESRKSRACKVCG